jgi:RNA methyltransferase, TrmH family
MTTTISSPANPLVKRARSLTTRKGRAEAGAFLVEGLRPVLTALEHEAPVEVLLCCPDRLTSRVGQDAMAQAAGRGVAVAALTPAAFASLSGRDNPVGLAAIVRMEPRPLADLAVTADAVFVALDDVADPGNLGTVLRSLDAAGVTGLILSGDSTDPYHPTAVRASMGTLFTLPWAVADDLATVMAWALAQSVFTAATSAHADVGLWDAPFPRPLLVLMGSEREGLPAAIRASADLAVRIPMWGTVSSLNLAVATALVVYEARRQAEAPAVRPASRAGPGSAAAS